MASYEKVMESERIEGEVAEVAVVVPPSAFLVSMVAGSGAGLAASVLCAPLDICKVPSMGGGRDTVMDVYVCGCVCICICT